MPNPDLRLLSVAILWSRHLMLDLSPSVLSRYRPTRSRPGGCPVASHGLLRYSLLHEEPTIIASSSSSSVTKRPSLHLLDCGCGRKAIGRKAISLRHRRRSLSGLAFCESRLTTTSAPLRRTDQSLTNPLDSLTAAIGPLLATAHIRTRNVAMLSTACC